MCTNLWTSGKADEIKNEFRCCANTLGRPVQSKQLLTYGSHTAPRNDPRQKSLLSQRLHHTLHMPHGQVIATLWKCPPCHAPTSNMRLHLPDTPPRHAMTVSQAACMCSRKHARHAEDLQCGRRRGLPRHSARELCGQRRGGSPSGSSACPPGTCLGHRRQSRPPGASGPPRCTP